MAQRDPAALRSKKEENPAWPFGNRQDDNSKKWAKIIDALFMQKTPPYIKVSNEIPQDAIETIFHPSLTAFPSHIARQRGG